MNLNPTVTRSSNGCLASSNVWQTVNTLSSTAKKINYSRNSYQNSIGVRDNSVAELEPNCWQELEHLNVPSSAIAKWDDSRLWEDFPADPTRSASAVRKIVFDSRRSIKPVNERCSLVTQNEVQEERIENDVDEEPSRCNNLVLHFYRQFKPMSKVKLM